MRDAAKNCICPPTLPVCVCNNRARFTLPLRNSVISAGESELEVNRRAACAKLRIADRTAEK
jgi:16S rRNA (cytosine1402-N4)-methyltransferase